MRLRHGRVSLALHERKGGEGMPLLLLHALRGSSADWPAAVDAWPGPVLALDFSGHGGSGWLRGGAYGPELLAGDADVALEPLARAFLLGAGLGAWVALLLAGARCEAVAAACLLPGAGLAGGGAGPPDFARAPAAARAVEARGCDPALARLDEDLRPVDYAASFAEAARRLLFVEDGGPRPPWWQAARGSPGAESACDLPAALARLRQWYGS
jgi:pimeloyl-ACP methyl ester carboxylesterase